jgi:hypothetical protein
MKKFDLNIEKILENWDLSHAIREVIANALDEQFLTNSKEVKISKGENSWIIRDFGRGLKYTHLTQNENKEKLTNSSVIGKFGIGLKDALATFDRKKIKVVAISKYGQITIEKSEKDGFKDIVTLHAIINEPNDSKFIGTEFELFNVSDKDIEKAKNLFLKFSGEKVIESTKFGQIVERKGDTSNIYINGVKVAEEKEFLFSYNITVINAAIKKSLNRERNNVGRTAYTDTIKKILLSSQSKIVAELLAEDLKNINRGTHHDELQWVDVQVHSVKILNQLGKYLFVTSNQAVQSPDMIDQAKESGYQVIFVPEVLAQSIEGRVDLSGNPIINIDEFESNYNDSFVFEFINPEKLTKKEKAIYSFTPQIIELFGGLPKKVIAIRISKIMRKDFSTSSETLGCWCSKDNIIVMSRKTLETIADYSGTLIHELIHAKTGQDDVSRAFENSLTEMIGHLCEKIFDDGTLVKKPLPKDTSGYNFFREFRKL